jgi:hypothetical protein
MGRVGSGSRVTESSSRRPPPQFVSKLRPLTIRDYELLSPAARVRREALEEAELEQWCDAQRRSAQAAGEAVVSLDAIAERW